MKVKPHPFKLHLMEVGDRFLVPCPPKGYSRTWHVSVSSQAANYARYLKNVHELDVSYRTYRHKPTDNDQRNGVFIERIPFAPRKKRIHRIEE